MGSIVNFLNTTAIVLWGTTLTSLEVFGFVTGIICVWLTVRKNIWNFPIGVLNSALLSFLFFNSRLFADAGLQLIFIALGGIGWWQWLSSKRNDKQLITDKLMVQTLSAVERISVLGLMSMLILMLYQGLTLLKGDVPFFDAAITAISIAAQVLLNKRYLENWWLWIVVDVISIPVYLHKGLYLIALLYVVFLILASMGLWAWKNSWCKQGADYAYP